MKKLEKYISILALCGLFTFVFLPIGIAVHGCTSGPQRVAYNTLWSVEQTTTAAFDNYLQQVIKGNVSTNDLPNISQKFNAFQASMQVALDGVQYNTNAIAPANLQVLSADIINLIHAVK